MRSKKLLCLLTILFPLFAAPAQVQIAIDFDKTKFIQHEPIDMTVQVINNSGTQLTFGKNSGKIEFLILSEVNKFNTIVAPYKANFNPAAGLILGAGETKKLSIRLNRHFPMSQDVKYRIRARISHDRLGNAVQTKKPFEIEVARGDEISTHLFGVPDITNPKKVKTRKYSLLGFNVNNNEMYCLKIYDENWVYALHRLGPKVQGIHPQHEVDSFSNVHVMIQLEPKVFIHSVFSPEGKKQQEVLYKASFDNVPRLVRDQDLGKISIRDGLKAIEGVDYVKQGNTYKILVK